MDSNQRGRYFQGNVMDKVVLTSSNACLGQMNRLYHVGLIRGEGNLNQSIDRKRSVHLTPVQGIVQMKPSFEYFDMAEKRLKDQTNTSGSNQDENAAYSTEDDADSEVETKPELVTLKYGAVGQVTQSAVEEQNWIYAKYIGINEDKSRTIKESLMCIQKEARLLVDLNNDELIKKSVDFNTTGQVVSSNSNNNVIESTTTTIKTEIK